LCNHSPTTFKCFICKKFRLYPADGREQQRTSSGLCIEPEAGDRRAPHSWCATGRGFVLPAPLRTLSSSCQTLSACTRANGHRAASPKRLTNVSLFPRCLAVSRAPSTDADCFVYCSPTKRHNLLPLHIGDRSSTAVVAGLVAGFLWEPKLHFRRAKSKRNCSQVDTKQRDKRATQEGASPCVLAEIWQFSDFFAWREFSLGHKPQRPH
jgi:hypothetical protein